MALWGSNDNITTFGTVAVSGTTVTGTVLLLQLMFQLDKLFVLVLEAVSGHIMVTQ